MNWLLQLFGLDRNFGVARNSKYRKASKEFKKGKVCELTGTKKKLQTHHIYPVWLFPEKEMDKDNWVVLSGAKIKGVIPHQWFGHYGDYRKYNPNIREDIKLWKQKIINRP